MSPESLALDDTREQGPKACALEPDWTWRTGIMATQDRVVDATEAHALADGWLAEWNRAGLGAAGGLLGDLQAPPAVEIVDRRGSPLPTPTGVPWPPP